MKHFTITWIGQGGFLLTLGDLTLCIDPYLSDSVNREHGFKRLVAPMPPERCDADMVVCSHDHLDHLDAETLLALQRSHTLFAGPESCLKHYASLGIPPKSLVSLGRGETVCLGDARLHGCFADHTPDSIGLVVEYSGRSLYFVGDSLYNEKLRQAKAYCPDILLVCINGKLGNMNYREAALLAAGLEVAAAVPCHYGMFAENTEDPLLFRDALKEGIRFVELRHFVSTSIKDICPL